MHRRCERAALRPPSRARNHPGAIFGAGGGGGTPPTEAQHTEERRNEDGPRRRNNRFQNPEPKCFVLTHLQVDAAVLLLSEPDEPVVGGDGEARDCADTAMQGQAARSLRG